MPAYSRTELRTLWRRLPRPLPLLFLALCLLFSGVSGQSGLGPQGVITGTVRAAETAFPLPGASVRLRGSDRAVLTNSRGIFHLFEVPTGTVVITVERIGYAATEREVLVRPESPSLVTVSLVAQAIGLDPLLVLLERTRMIGDPPLNLQSIPGSAYFLTRDDLLGQKIPFDDVHQALRQLPGVIVQDEEGFGRRPNVGLRGTGVERSSKITLMEDGVLIAPAPYAAPAAYYFPVAGRMETIEVRAGSSQIKYGPRTIGGAINMVSSSIPQERSGFMDLASGPDRSLKAHGRAGDTAGRLGWMLEGYHLRTDGFKTLQGGGSTGFDVSDIIAKVRYRTAESAGIFHDVELKAGYTRERSSETYLGLTDADFQGNPLSRYPASEPDLLRARHRQLQLRWFARPSDVLDLTTTAYYNGFHRNWYKLQSVNGSGISDVLDSPAEFGSELGVLRGNESGDDALRVRANNRDYWSRGLQSVIGVNVGRGLLTHRIELGVRVHQDSEARFQHEDGYRMAGGRMVLTSSGAPGSQSNRVSMAKALAFYFHDKISVGEWTLSPGVRFETVDFSRRDYAASDPDRAAPTQIRDNGLSAWIPGVGATRVLMPSTHIFAGVHRGFGPPGPGASGEARPEQSVNYEAGVRVRTRGLAIQASAFYSDYGNILGKETLATGESGVGDTHNGGSVEVYGLEGSGEYDLAWGRDLPVRLPVRATYTFTHAAFRSSFDSDYGPWGTVSEGDLLPYSPRHMYTASAGLDRGKWDVTLSVFGQAAMRSRAGQGFVAPDSSIDAFTVLNLGGEVTLLGGGALYVSVRNLLDRRYVVARRPAGARPGLPRTLMVGYRLGS